MSGGEVKDRDVDLNSSMCPDCFSNECASWDFKRGEISYSDYSNSDDFAYDLMECLHRQLALKDKTITRLLQNVDDLERRNHELTQEWDVLASLVANALSAARLGWEYGASHGGIEDELGELGLNTAEEWDINKAISDVWSLRGNMPGVEYEEGSNGG